jgi:hypothetical protein
MEVARGEGAGFLPADLRRDMAALRAACGRRIEHGRDRNAAAASAFRDALLSARSLAEQNVAHRGTSSSPFVRDTHTSVSIWGFLRGCQFIRTAPRTHGIRLLVRCFCAFREQFVERAAAITSYPLHQCLRISVCLRLKFALPNLV